MKYIVLYSIFAFLITSCTTSLKSEKLDPNLTSAAPVGSGLSYKLPVKRFTLEMVGEITDCKTISETTYELDTKVSTNLSSAIEGDDSNVYLLDYQKLKSKTKTQDLTVNMGKNGMLTSINSHSIDQTGPIIANVATSIFSLALGQAMPLSDPLGGSAPGILPGKKPASVPPPFLINSCPSFITEKVSEISKIEKEIKTVQTSLLKKSKIEADISKQIDVVTALSADLKFFQENKSKLKNKTEKQLDQAKLLLDEKKKLLLEFKDAPDIDKLKSNVDKLKNELTFKNLKTDIPNPQKNAASILSSKDIFIAISFQDDPAFIQKVFKSSSVDKCLNCPTIKLKIAKSTVNASQPNGKKYSTNSLVDDHENGKSENINNAIKSEKPTTGIAYRIPANADLEIILSRGKNDLILQKSIQQLPQYGYIATLDLVNKAFEDTKLSVSFDENGSINTLSFNTNAGALEASKSAKDVFNGYLNFVKENEKNKYDSKKQSLELSKAALDVEKAESDLSLLNSNNELTSSNNSIQLLKNLLQLQASQSGDNSTNYESINKLEYENKILNLQIEQAKKQKELRELQKQLTATGD